MTGCTRLGESRLMPESLLIANRGEIAVRIARTAGDLGVETVAVYAEDDAASLHTREADRAVSLGATGVPAYLDGAAVIAAARAAGCDAVHPGYGFLSESAAFAAACQQAGLTFVGPAPETLALFGDKAAARALAQRCGVPLLAGTSTAVTLAGARDFLAGLGPGGAVMLKAVAGGGGRGMRRSPAWPAWRKPSRGRRRRPPAPSARASCTSRS